MLRSHTVRCGHVVIYVLPDGSMRVGLVTSVWKVGSRRKTLMVGPCPLTHCHCFRAVELAQTEDALSRDH